MSIYFYLILLGLFNAKTSVWFCLVCKSTFHDKCLWLKWKVILGELANGGIIARACPPRSIEIFWSPLPPNSHFSSRCIERERESVWAMTTIEMMERDAMKTVAPCAAVTYHRRVRGDLDDTLPKPCTYPDPPPPQKKIYTY